MPDHARDPALARAEHRAALEERLRAGAWLWRAPLERQEEQLDRAERERRRKLERGEVRREELLARLARLEAGGAPDEIAAIQAALAAASARLQRLAAPLPPPPRFDAEATERADRERYAAARQRSRETADAWRRARRASGRADASGPARAALSIVLSARILRRELIEASTQRVRFWARREDALTIGAPLSIRISLRGEAPAPASLAVVAVGSPDARGLREVTGYLLD